MKTFFTLFALLFSFAAAQAQDITADTTRANALYEQGEAMRNQEYYDSALQLFRKTLPIYGKHKLWGDYYSSTADEIWCLLFLGRLDSAASLGKAYLQEAKGKLPKLSEVMSRVLYNVGAVCYYQAEYANALKYWQASMEIDLVLSGGKSAGVAGNYNNIAMVYKALSQNMKALEYFKESLSIRLELFGEKHLDVADSYNNIGVVHKDLNHYREALDYFQKSLGIKLELLGEKHPNIADTYINMGLLSDNLAQYEEALAYFKKSLKLKLSISGKQGIEIASIYNNMANAHYSQVELQKALEYYQKSLSIRLNIFGRKHTEVAMGYHNIGLCYIDLNQYDSAAYFHNQAVKAMAVGFESNELHQNPKPKQAIEKNALMKYLQHKAEALTLLGQEENALQTYVVAAACAKLAMFEADRENDKLAVASRAHAVHTQAALLHFVRGKREEAEKP
jgi:tetratricopeptide (TPR) repeat protein